MCNEDYEIINLTPDMAQVWGNMLKKLRDQKNNSLYAVCTNADVEFTPDEIRIHAVAGEMTILNKNKDLFNGILGDGVLKILNKQNTTRNQKTEKLKKLFGADIIVYSTKS